MTWTWLQLFERESDEKNGNLKILFEDCMRLCIYGFMSWDGVGGYCMEFPPYSPSTSPCCFSITYYFPRFISIYPSSIGIFHRMRTTV
jgi:hypothetical protein